MGGGGRKKGSCINSCLADSIYKVDFIAKVFVLVLKCLNSPVISLARRRGSLGGGHLRPSKTFVEGWGGGGNSRDLSLNQSFLK